MKYDLKLYRGYLNDQELTVFGHVFKSWAPDKYEIDRKGIKHAISILQMFNISPLANTRVRLEFMGLNVETKTWKDGFFRFNLPFKEPLESGWHPYKIYWNLNGISMVEQGEVLKPFKSKYVIISDIDDTFLISHSDNFFKKLYVLLLKNINKRKIYNDVVRHYQALSVFGQDVDGAFNSFFYVSSSEWNLYEFITQFADRHGLPKAILKLKEIKTGLSDFLMTGSGSHDHKFIKIQEIIAFYPDLHYILLGDDSQRDPYIYDRICKIFPQNITAVYIRQTGRKMKSGVQSVLQNMEDMGVSTCYFEHSEKAITHSQQIKII